MCAGATSMPSCSVWRMTSVSVDRPSARTSAIDRSTALRLTPRPAVRLAWGSMSTHKTRKPSSASAPARLIAVVVLPTPPFWLAIAITLVTGASPRVGERLWAGGGDGERGHATPALRVRGTPVIHTQGELFTVSVDNWRPYDGHCPCAKTVASGPEVGGRDQCRTFGATRGDARGVEARRRRRADRAPARARKADRARASRPSARPRKLRRDRCVRDESRSVRLGRRPGRWLCYRPRADGRAPGVRVQSGLHRLRRKPVGGVRREDLQGHG